MKIQVKNLGVLKQAEFELGSMTILCGGNNTGKTYATYALFGFLFGWADSFVIRHIMEDPTIVSDISDGQIKQLLNEGILQVDIPNYIQRIPEIVTGICKLYKTDLPTVFAASEEKFKDSQFMVTFDTEEIHLVEKYEKIFYVNNIEISIVNKTGTLIVTLLGEYKKFSNLEKQTDLIRIMIIHSLVEIMFEQMFPKPFIVSAERTGAAIFHKELNFNRTRLLEEMNQDKDADLRRLLSRFYQDYPMPIKVNMEFTQLLEKLAKNNSFIKKEHPDILADFADIIGGDYTITQNNELYYKPKGKPIKLTMGESSSAIRSLLNIGFYLEHVAKPNDLLMVDEPELNLHPENQRRIARLFARLVNLGIKVFITTHSDYIIKELNTLIMLNHDKPHLKKIAEQEGYKPEELISASKIKVYIAEQALIKLDGAKRKTRCQTLVPANIDPELGIEARSFDTTIETMNRIQEAIVWGAEE